MPVYAYACENCESQFEVRQSFSDDPLTACKVCEEVGSVRRLISAPAIVFKGSGFYVTDNKGSNGANGANGHHTNGSGSGNGAKKADEGSSEAPKAEKKTEAKTEKKAEKSTASE